MNVSEQRDGDENTKWIQRIREIAAVIVIDRKRYPTDNTVMIGSNSFVIYSSTAS